MAVPLYSLTIQQKHKETFDSANFVFSVPEEQKNLFYHRPAQFLTFEFHIQGKRLLRSYSLSSCPLLNEPLTTTVKRVKGGVISNYMIDHLKEGDVIKSRKPAGRFFKMPTDLKPKHYYLFAGGSGITPMFSIIKTALVSDPKNKVTLFYANRNEDSIIYLSQIKQWLKKYPSQFKMLLALSQPKNNGLVAEYIPGRWTKPHLHKFVPPEPLLHLSYYLCGPLGFMQTVEQVLTEKQISQKQIHKESFYTPRPCPLGGTSPSLGEATSLGEAEHEHKAPHPEGHYSRSAEGHLLMKGKEGASELAPTETIRAFINEEEVHISAQKDTPILEQLLSNGHSPPFSCLSGSCLSCLAVLKKGQVVQEEEGILEEEHKKNHEILTCQAKPLSRVVEVDYDQVL